MNNWDIILKKKHEYILFIYHCDFIVGSIYKYIAIKNPFKLTSRRCRLTLAIIILCEIKWPWATPHARCSCSLGLNDSENIYPSIWISLHTSMRTHMCPNACVYIFRAYDDLCPFDRRFCETVLWRSETDFPANHQRWSVIKFCFVHFSASIHINLIEWSCGVYKKTQFLCVKGERCS